MIFETDEKPALLDIVIVNWNTGDCLSDCLRSIALAGTGLPLGPTVVVDNASRDGSAVDLPCPPEVVLISNTANVGFAAACNQGARLGSGQYLLFLNPDTVLLPDTLQQALDFMESAQGAQYGICGGLVLHPDGTPGISASRFPTLANVVTGTLGLERVVGHWIAPRHLLAAEVTTSGPVDQVIGAFFLVRRSLFDRLEGFDKRYFLYYEEVDFCARAAALGAHAFLLSDAKLHHIENVSAKQSGGRSLFHSLRSRTLYAARHWSRTELVVLVAFTLLLELQLRLLRATLRFNVEETTAVVRALASYAKFVVQTPLQSRLTTAEATATDRQLTPAAGHP